MKIDAHAAESAGAKLRPFTCGSEPLGPDDVEVAIPHCGIRHSDVHMHGHLGGLADRIRVDRRFAVPVAAEIPGETAAPALCGGITVYSPLVCHGRQEVR